MFLNENNFLSKFHPGWSTEETIEKKSWGGGEYGWNFDKKLFSLRDILFDSVFGADSEYQICFAH